MKIVVCIKQVPDTTEVKLDPKTGTLIRDGVPSIINPDDKSGLESALVLKDKYGAHVTAVTMGPPQAEKALREALAMGVDEAVLLTDRVFAGADTLATSTALAHAIKTLDYDLIITGRQAIDGDTAQVGPQIAEHLDIPQVSYVSSIEKINNGLVLKRSFEDRYHMLGVDFPCLITTLSELNEPRYMSVSGILDAYREKEIRILNFKDINANVEQMGLKGSPTKVKKSFTKGIKASGAVYELPPKESAKIIVEKLLEKYYI
ncbi:electron transfer flavoprotein subunit beta/FixA family protein [Helicovermis profundi]|uniref:Electron transfer flavoprotein small subunit n=1 Tax=Helicovermis profundi TaxID=3065157 RepID=A0AAU9E211_9FIRM|nr:electron transfer flavoprotein subunit beta/FixA family protein [Clostridia bacterium S502]